MIVLMKVDDVFQTKAAGVMTVSGFVASDFAADETEALEKVGPLVIIRTLGKEEFEFHVKSVRLSLAAGKTKLTLILKSNEDTEIFKGSTVLTL